jgi:hypothetical protein
MDKVNSLACEQAVHCTHASGDIRRVHARFSKARNVTVGARLFAGESVGFHLFGFLPLIATIPSSRGTSTRHQHISKNRTSFGAFPKRRKFTHGGG